MYTTLAQVRAEIGERDATVTSNDAFNIEAMRFVVARINQETGREFAPRIEARYLDAIPMSKGGPVQGATLWLDRELLAVNTLTNGDGTVIDSASYRLLPRNEGHKTRIRLIDTTWTYTDDPVEAIEVDGVWAYHRRPSEAWLSSGDAVQNDPLSASGTTITVNDADGADGRNRQPRFSPGQLLGIEDEYVEVLAVDTESNVLTVLRGVRGSTAVAHTKDTTIVIWQPDPQVELAATRWAALCYRRRGEFVRTQTEGFTTFEWPKDAPDNVVPILNSLRRVGSVRST